ncbi:MAG: hypothetical protein ACM3N1_00150 [Accumulibacter sp.]
MTNNTKKRRILQELGLRKALEDNIKPYSDKTDLRRLSSEFQAGLAEEANKQNQKNTEVLSNEYE